ncbi:hypothetical protein [Pseudogemmobacter faecipullorum]|uniref:Uncharacterized protein n=1 Tax=Pseudogemmobacter faecipullorum TaxID=2755041 RepID=A0ABS8CQ24_9RHOB|nr:hypothetical protein [Pseudogemmobacter faecipullorum]MCB5411502.1 hypothetical protein [Pseudogemmobacter faecipullorum]
MKISNLPDELLIKVAHLVAELIADGEIPEWEQAELVKSLIADLPKLQPAALEELLRRAVVKLRALA